MKRILSIFLLLLLITACDDGDITVDVIDFSEATAQKCSDKDVIYKVKDSEMLLIEIPVEATLTEDETPADAPIQLQINATNKVTYRKYNGTVSANNICPTIPDGTPNVIEQWTAIDGIIEIKATAIKTTNTTTGFVSISGYRYDIAFKNITFQKPNGTQRYDDFPFGNYNTTSSSLAFGFDTIANKSTCSSTDNRIFNFSGSEALIFDTANYSTLFPDAETAGTPRTALISSENKLTYRLFDGTINNAYFCAATVPAIPDPKQEWNALDGVDTVSGMIEVTTVASGTGTGFSHTIHLKNVILKKGNTTFSLGNDYTFGSFESAP